MGYQLPHIVNITGILKTQCILKHDQRELKSDTIIPVEISFIGLISPENIIIRDLTCLLLGGVIPRNTKILKYTKTCYKAHQEYSNTDYMNFKGLQHMERVYRSIFFVN